MVLLVEFAEDGVGGLLHELDRSSSSFFGG